MKIPFNEKEMIPVSETINFFSGKKISILDTPIPPGDNFLNTILKKDYAWVPNYTEQNVFMPRCVPDNIARANVLDGGEMLAPHTEGYPDMFGVEWVYIPVATGAMPRSGVR